MKTTALVITSQLKKNSHSKFSYLIALPFFVAVFLRNK